MKSHKTRANGLKKNLVKNFTNKLNKYFFFWKIIVFDLIIKFHSVFKPESKNGNCTISPSSNFSVYAYFILRLYFTDTCCKDVLQLVQCTTFIYHPIRYMQWKHFIDPKQNIWKLTQSYFKCNHIKLLHLKCCTHSHIHPYK